MLKRVNDSIAIKVVLFVGTMECAYAFTVFALIPLIIPKFETFVQFTSSSLLQLVLLPIIMVGQAKLNEKTELRAQQDHEMIMTELTILKQLHKELEVR